MTANVPGGETPFPTRGVPGGWRDCWDDPDDSAELRARAEAAEECLLARVVDLGAVWRRELARATVPQGNVIAH